MLPFQVADYQSKCLTTTLYLVSIRRRAPSSHVVQLRSIPILHRFDSTYVSNSSGYGSTRLSLHVAQLDIKMYGSELLNYDGSYAIIYVSYVLQGSLLRLAPEYSQVPLRSWSCRSIYEVSPFHWISKRSHCMSRHTGKVINQSDLSQWVPSSRRFVDLPSVPYSILLRYPTGYLRWYCTTRLSLRVAVLNINNPYPISSQYVSTFIQPLVDMNYLPGSSVLQILRIGILLTCDVRLPVHLSSR